MGLHPGPPLSCLSLGWVSAPPAEGEDAPGVASPGHCLPQASLPPSKLRPRPLCYAVLGGPASSVPPFPCLDSGSSSCPLKIHCLGRQLNIEIDRAQRMPATSAGKRGTEGAAVREDGAQRGLSEIPSISTFLLHAPLRKGCLRSSLSGKARQTPGGRWDWRGVSRSRGREMGAFPADTGALGSRPLRQRDYSR